MAARLDFAWNFLKLAQATGAFWPSIGHPGSSPSPVRCRRSAHPTGCHRAERRLRPPWSFRIAYTSSPSPTPSFSLPSVPNQIPKPPPHWSSIELPPVTPRSPASCHSPTYKSPIRLGHFPPHPKPLHPSSLPALSLLSSRANSRHCWSSSLASLHSRVTHRRPRWGSPRPPFPLGALAASSHALSRPRGPLWWGVLPASPPGPWCTGEPPPPLGLWSL
jgi:hypothetical protein